MTTCRNAVHTRPLSTWCALIFLCAAVVGRAAPDSLPKPAEKAGSTPVPTQSGPHSYLNAARACMDVLAQEGTDHYGAAKTPVLASILDVQTRQCPSNPAALDEAWRVIRRERRNPAGANLLSDLRTLQTMTMVSGISGDPSLGKFADRYVSWYLEHLVDDNGLIWWGWHRHYDLFSDQKSGHLGNYHEIHATQEILWGYLWRVNPAVVRREIEAIWKWHVIDKKTGEVDRHSSGVRGCDFAMSAGACAQSFAFLYRETREPVWLERALLLANYYWDRRNPSTGLFPERPNAGTDRFDGGHFLTSSAGLYCHSLLKCSELTGNPRFREQALAYLKAYGRFGYDSQTGKFWGSLKLDGTPVHGPRVAPKGAGELMADDYQLYEPRGHLDLWQPYAIGYEHPIAAAQVYSYAALTTHDPEIRETAERFARWIQRELPPRGCETNTWYKGYAATYAPKGTYAGLYGQTISFFLQMHLVSGKASYLQNARDLADEAIAKLSHNGLFRGHPAKPYYESVDGVGQLLYALVQLDRVLAGAEWNPSESAISLRSGTTTAMPIDNW